MSRLTAGNRTTLLLALAVVASAALLAASEFMTTFEFTPPGGEALEVPQSVTEAADRHNYAMLVLSIFAVVALVGAVGYGSQPAAFAVAAAGGIALLIFLIGDLPDANKIGTLDDERESFIDAKAEPQTGFWLTLIGALMLAITGGALATVPPDQLRLRGGDDAGSTPRRRRRGGGGGGGKVAADEGGGWRWPTSGGKSRRGKT